MENTVEKLYQYLKSIYGVANTEKINPSDYVFKSVTIDIPGLKKRPEGGSWKTFIEKGNNGEIYLIIGEFSPTDQARCTRFIQIIDFQEEKTLVPFFKIVRPMPLDDLNDLGSLIVLIKVLEDFLKKCK